MNQSLFTNSFQQQATALCETLAALPEAERIEAINQIKLMLHEISPFKDEPVDCVLWVKAETVEGNEYNPNSVAPPEMRLLEQSIKEDGYTQPVVTYRLSAAIAQLRAEGLSDADIKQQLVLTDERFNQFTELSDGREIVDGFHRNRVGKESPVVRRRTLGYLPVTSVRPKQEGRANRRASTIRHNRARGTHSIDLMVNIVRELSQAGMGNDWICKNIGMDADELLRLKQLSGLAALFQTNRFSQAWVSSETEAAQYQ